MHKSSTERLAWSRHSFDRLCDSLRALRCCQPARVVALEMAGQVLHVTILSPFFESNNVHAQRYTYLYDFSAWFAKFLTLLGNFMVQGSNTDRQGLTAQELAWLATMPNSARTASKNKTGLSKLVPKKSWIPGVSSKKQGGGPVSEASDTLRMLDQVCTLQCIHSAADNQRKHEGAGGMRLIFGKAAQKSTMPFPCAFNMPSTKQKDNCCCHA